MLLTAERVGRILRSSLDRISAISSGTVLSQPLPAELLFPILTAWQPNWESKPFGLTWEYGSRLITNSTQLCHFHYP